MSTKPNDKTAVDAYIKSFPKEVQELLEKLRLIMKTAAPDSTEGISYGIPTIYLNGKYLVYFAAFKNHLSVYPATTAAVEAAGLTAFKVSQGTLKFPLNMPLPFDLIQKFVELRVREHTSE
jgi:uncharacterized protein YdhG (YjbR/CyaY superfamily)